MTYERTAASFDNPDFVAVVIHSYRHRFALAPGDPAVEATERRSTERPPIQAPTVVLHGGNSGLPPLASPEATISVGSVGLEGDVADAYAGKSSKTRGLNVLIERMERNEFDLIAVGLALLTDSNWVAKVPGTDKGSFKGFDVASMAELV